VQALLDELTEPILSMTLQLPADDSLLNDAWEIRDRLESQVDLVIDSAISVAGLTTVVDLTTVEPALIRQGMVDAAQFGL
jgi:tRNA A37 threonylcarbamoyladenosine synthetase subunit TsaC/SUA5/YrdC